VKWIKTGWGKQCSPNFDPNVSYVMDYKDIITNSKTPITTIAKRVISDITKEYPKPYYLMLSGGIDSQCMLWLWKQAGVPFIPTSFRYIHHEIFYNQHDLEILLNVADINNVEIQYIDFDVIQFLETELYEYAIKYKCTSPQICSHMKMADMIEGGTVIFGGNFAAHSFYTYTILGLERYARLSGRSTIPFFLLHDAELAGAASYIDPASHGLEYHVSKKKHYDAKITSIKELEIPILPQSDKLTGFEKIKDLYDTQHSRVSSKDKILFSKMPSKRVFDILFRYNLMKSIKYKDKITYKNTHFKTPQIF
jgi:hypothetical protein